MSTKTLLESSLKEAMRSNNELRKRTLRLALAAIRMAEVERQAELNDAAVLAILQKEIKSRSEAMEDAHKAGRTDLIDVYQAEQNELQEFLPAQLTDVELEELARQAIAEVRAVGLNEVGRVMKVLAPNLQGRATGERASQMVRKLLIP
jgi:uncharacterized protein YqeY